jgi:outer membrane lipoprotein-sorting protein
MGAERRAASIVPRPTGAVGTAARTRTGAHPMLRKILMAVTVLALLAPIASAQTVDELVVKYTDAKGGLTKLKAINSVKLTGKMVVGQGIELPLVMYQKRPKSFRMEFSVQGMNGTQAYDGKNAWMVMPMMGKKDPEAMGADETKQMDEQAEFDGPLMDYKEKGNKVELVGKEQVEGADAYKLKITLKNGDLRYVYLDAETYLEVKTEGKRNVRGTEMEGESYMSDYREVDGMMVPFAVEAGTKGSPQRQKIVIEKVEFNTTMSDTLFAMPAGTAAPAKVADAVAKDGAKATAKTVEAAKTAAAAKTDSTKVDPKKKK